MKKCLKNNKKCLKDMIERWIKKSWWIKSKRIKKKHLVKMTQIWLFGPFGDLMGLDMMCMSDDFGIVRQMDFKLNSLYEILNENPILTKMNNVSRQGWRNHEIIFKFRNNETKKFLFDHGIHIMEEKILTKKCMIWMNISFS